MIVWFLFVGGGGVERGRFFFFQELEGEYFEKTDKKCRKIRKKINNDGRRSFLNKEYSKLFS